MISQNEIQPVDKFIEKALYDKKIGTIQNLILLVKRVILLLHH